MPGLSVNRLTVPVTYWNRNAVTFAFCSRQVYKRSGQFRVDLLVKTLIVWGRIVTTIGMNNTENP